MNDWYHETNPNWMQARMKYLNASEIKSLIPFTATGRPRKVTDEDYRKLALAKNRTINPSDVISTGAMARGHILEPYAVNTFNGVASDISSKIGMPVPTMYHWDDALIYSENAMASFSPDACDIRQPSGDIEFNAKQPGVMYLHTILEIKSYNPDRHLSALYQDPMTMEERWQIATAMVIDPKIIDAYLMHYNPAIEQSVIIHHFSNKDLADEREEIMKVLVKWKEIYDQVVERDIGTPNPKAMLFTSVPYEQRIIENEEKKRQEQALKAQSFNPQERRFNG